MRRGWLVTDVSGQPVCYKPC